MSNQPKLATHLEAIEASMRELVALSPNLAKPASLQHQYIGTCVDNTIVLLTSVANSIDAGGRNVTFTEERNWHSAMQAVHRSFYSMIVNCTEKACADLCKAKKIKPTVHRQGQVDKIMGLIRKNSSMDTAVDTKLETKIRSIVGTKPSFLDYINSVIRESKIPRDRAKVWRNYFAALNIVRNKSSHSEPDLSGPEVKALKAGGFGALVSNKNELQINTSNYKQVCDHITLFFNELSA